AAVEADVPPLAAELERQRYVAPGELTADRLADLGRAGERDLVDANCPNEVGAGRSAAGDDVDAAGRHLRLPADVGEEERGQRSRLCRLEHDGVAARERGRDLPGQHQKREVPGNDLRRHAEWPRLTAREGVLELVGPAGVVEEVRGSE